MKYMLLIHSNPQNWGHPTFLYTAQAQAMSPEERVELSRELETLLAEITESGELVTAEALPDPARTRTVRSRDGVPTVTDGPFVEAKEQFAGFFIVDCETPERATEIAARFPDIRFGGAVEIRPLMERSGQEM